MMDGVVMVIRWNGVPMEIIHAEHTLRAYAIGAVSRAYPQSKSTNDVNAKVFVFFFRRFYLSFSSRTK